jgi:transcriptional regulator with XRE-family HTH domain
MAPFAETLLAWRLARGLTQDELARAARIPRPNLSAIERGHREVTLKTLRALALALDINPGLLADGVAPGAQEPPLRRKDLERVAWAASAGGDLPVRRQGSVAVWLEQVAFERLAAGGEGSRRSRSGPRQKERAWLRLKAAESRETVRTLIERVTHRREGR